MISKSFVNYLYIGLFYIVSTSLIIKPCLAQDLIVNNHHQNNLIKKAAIYRVLDRYDAPLKTEVDSFLNACISYEINCYLLPSIAGVESTFGKHLLPGGYNPFGWGGGYLYFDSWQEGFFTVAEGIREKYLNYGLTSVEAIAPVYAPPSKTWAGKILMYMQMFKEEEEKINTSILEI